MKLVKLVLVVFIAFILIVTDKAYSQSSIDNQYNADRKEDEILTLKEKLKAYGKNEDETAIPELKEGIKNKNADIRTSASWALAMIADKSTVPELTSLLDDEDYRVRGNAVYGLGRIGGNLVIPPLIKALKDDSKDVRQNTIAGLIKIGRPAVPALIEVLERERAGSSNDTAIHAVDLILGKIGDKSAIPELYKFLNEPGSNAALYATEAICNIGINTKDETVIYELIKFMFKQMDQLKGIPTEEIENYMVGLLGGGQSGEENYNVKLQESFAIFTNVSMGMSNIGKPLIPMLMKALDNDDEMVRLFAVGFLAVSPKSYSTYNQQTLIESLIARLNDRSPKVRSLIKDALKDITEKNFGEDQKAWQEWRDKQKNNIEIIDDLTLAKLGRIKADKIMDLEDSLVMYEIPISSGESMDIYVTYEDTRPNPEVLNVDFSLEPPKQDGEHIFYLDTEQKTKIKVKFVYSKGELAYSFDTDYRPKKPSGIEHSIFTVVSKKGYRINFIFYWKDGGLDNIEVSPKQNPFS